MPVTPSDIGVTGIVGYVLDSTLSTPEPYINFVKKKSDIGVTAIVSHLAHQHSSHPYVTFFISKIFFALLVDP